MRWRYILMVVGGLVLALLLYLLVQVSGIINRTVPSENQAGEPAKIERSGIRPVTFANVNAFTEDGQSRLRLSGSAEPEAVVVITNRGERLRQIKTDADGSWSLTLEAGDRPMALEALLFVEDMGANMRSDETVFRIPVPNAEAVASANFITPALVMISAPGMPSRIMQSPFGGSPTSGPLMLGAIDYDDAGGVIISGTTSEPGRVRLYAGGQANEVGQAIGETRVGPDGRWSFIAGKMLPRGEYNVSAELIRTDGPRVQISVPFEMLAPIPEMSDDSGAITVSFQPYRWQVRRALLGGGLQSTVIFAPMPEAEIEPETSE